MAKPRIERSLLFPNKEFRERVRKASKDRGFRSEQAFILAACEREIRRGDDTESVTQFEARIAATLTNLAKQGQHLQTLVEAQVAMTDVLLKYVITCVVEPPEDALPAARVRARLRYDKLIRAAAKELSNKNRDTLREMVVGLLTNPIGGPKSGKSFSLRDFRRLAYVSTQYHAGQLAPYPERDGTRVRGLSHISTLP